MPGYLGFFAAIGEHPSAKGHPNRDIIDMEEIDRRLLRELQRDGRITNQELAKRCNLSPAACFERVKRLRERGVIPGYAALLDPQKLGLSLLIFVEVRLDRTT